MQTKFVKRGNETEAHQSHKLELRALLLQLGYPTVFCEHGCSDVVALDYGRVLAGEVERSNRNLLPNIKRDVARGADYVLVACPDFESLGAVARKLSRELPQELAGKVGLVTIQALRMLGPSSSNNKAGPPQVGPRAPTDNSLSAT